MRSFSIYQDHLKVRSRATGHRGSSVRMEYWGPDIEFWLCSLYAIF